MKNKSVVLVAVVVLLLAGIWLVNINNHKENGDVNKNPEITVESIDPYLPSELSRPKIINWDNFGGELPTTAEKMVVTQKEWNNAETERVAVILGEKVGGLGENGWVVIGDDKKGGFIDQQNNLIEWQKRIESRGEIPTGKIPTQSGAKEKIEKLVKQISKQEVTLIWKQVRYVKVVYPRWIECPVTEADMVELEADMELEGKKISSFGGRMVTAVLGKNDQLIKLNLRLPPAAERMEDKINLKKSGEIEKGRMDNFGISRIEGNQEGEIKIATINAVNAQLWYIYGARGNWLKPYWQIEGNSYAGGSPIRLSMWYRAEK